MLSEPVGDGDADGVGLAEVLVLVVPSGAVAQPAATIARAMTSPTVVILILCILKYLCS